jgi:EAL domain-containing protein (putative c-di-GMP-specific phosphodiesterase class I)
VEIQNDDASSPEQLLAHADGALYEAKEAGRGTIAVSDLAHDGRAAFQLRLNWAERIRKALEEDSFVLFEQPIVTLCTGQVDRSELLLRMGAEHDALVEASAFLPIAERFNQTPDIDLWVIRQLGHSHVDRIAVRAIVEMANGLEKTTVAKGVEDERTLELVRELGIDHAQGFHVGRPAQLAGGGLSSQ